MAEFHKYPGEADYEGLALTAEQYLAIGETQARYELIDGRVVRHPSPTVARQVLMSELDMQLLRWERQHPGAFAVRGVDVKLSEELVYCPDMVVYRPGRLARTPDRLDTPPDLVIDVAWGWEAARDFERRGHEYARFGLPEYWVLDVAGGVARVWERVRFASVHGGVVRSTRLNDFVIEFRR